MFSHPGRQLKSSLFCLRGHQSAQALLLSFPCLTFSYTFCPSSHHPGCPPYFLLFLPATSLASHIFINFQFRFNFVVGSLLSPLDLCNMPSSSRADHETGVKCSATCSPRQIILPHPHPVGPSRSRHWFGVLPPVALGR
jgi:hypothetical protein